MNNLLKWTGAAAVIVMAGVAGCGGGGGGGNGNNATYLQQERLSRPVTNEVFATVADNRHFINDTDNPTDDKNQLANDIQSFMTTAAGRSQATTDVVKAVVVGTTGDVMKVDLTQTGEAAYLGLETGGATSATGSTFGGRKLTDDVVDTSLGIIFGNTLFAIGVGPDDRGTAIATLTKDNVGPAPRAYRPDFPYLGNPR